jgi:predicted GNAT family acetyltransferase
MTVVRHANAREFLQHAESWLLQAEPENNLTLGIAGRYRDHESDVAPEMYWATVTNAGHVVGAAFRTPPHLLSVCDLPAKTIPALIDEVAAVYPDLPGVVGPAHVAELFAQLWTNRFGGSWRVKIRQRIHVLTAVKKAPTRPNGSLRRMEHADSELILSWMDAFVRESGIVGPAERVVRPVLEQRKFYLWDDDGPRCIAAAARDTPHGACVNAVYTPPEQRRKGYATAAVGALSGMLLAAGKDFCCLYTDVANPTSNSIYRKIGYRPVRDDAELLFA